MGYYIDFIFNPEAIHDYETVVDKFKKQGAKIHIDDTCDERYVDLDYEGLNSPITVFKRESKNLKGNWAHVRLSWGTDSQTLYRELRCMLTLAKQCGAHLYDGQANMEIKEEVLSAIHEEFMRGSEWAINLFGTCTDKPGPG